jgi:hypothetical protein
MKHIKKKNRSYCLLILKTFGIILEQELLGRELEEVQGQVSERLLAEVIKV